MKDNKQFQFQKWLVYKSGHGGYDYNTPTYNKQIWHQLPFSMQWGVYLEFFDSVGLWIEVIVHYKNTNSKEFDGYINYGTGWDNLGMEKIHRKPTRQEAQQESIKKAFDLLESK